MYNTWNKVVEMEDLAITSYSLLLFLTSPYQLTLFLSVIIPHQPLPAYIVLIRHYYSPALTSLHLYY
jgi:hypothetical protein